MNEIENKNRETRIKQQKNLFWKRTFILLALILVITIAFVAMKSNATGTRIDINTFETKKINNLFLTGELLDVDGDCGGYNLGIAYNIFIRRWYICKI